MPQPLKEVDLIDDTDRKMKKTMFPVEQELEAIYSVRNNSALCLNRLIARISGLIRHDEP